MSSANALNLVKVKILLFGVELTKEEILSSTKLITLADDKINVARIMISDCNGVENNFGGKKWKCWLKAFPTWTLHVL